MIIRPSNQPLGGHVRSSQIWVGLDVYGIHKNIQQHVGSIVVGHTTFHASLHDCHSGKLPRKTPFVLGVLGATLRNGNMDFTKENWAVTAGLVLVGIWVAAPPSPPESHLLQS